jgi:two-component system, response regulator RpfG
MNVLILDDQASARIMLKRIIVDAMPSISIHEFGAPMDALDWCQGNRPDLIILDFSMPDMDGIQFVRSMRRMRQHAEVPVILVTVSVDDSMRVHAFDAGIDDVMIKPVVAKELQLRARRLLQVREHALGLETRIQHLEAKVASKVA